MKNCDRVVMFTLDDEAILVIVVAFRQGATLDSRADRQQEQSRLLLHHPRAIPFIVRLFFVWSQTIFPSISFVLFNSECGGALIKPPESQKSATDA